MSKTIAKYGFDSAVIEVVRPIIEMLDTGNIGEAERRLAELCIDVCDRIEAGTLPPRVGDAYFTLVDLYAGDNHPEVTFSSEVIDILVGGMTLHDYSTQYAPDLNALKMLAAKILRRD